MIDNREVILVELLGISLGEELGGSLYAFDRMAQGIHPSIGRNICLGVRHCMESEQEFGHGSNLGEDLVGGTGCI